LNELIKSTPPQNPILKQPHKIGTNTVVSIDESIVEKLNIAEENTFLQQELTEDCHGILMRVRKMDGSLLNDHNCKRKEYASK